MEPDNESDGSRNGIDLATNLADDLRFCEQCDDFTAHVQDGDDSHRCLACPSEDETRKWVAVSRPTAEILVEAGDTLLEDIGNGRQWGWTPEVSAENAETLATAVDETHSVLGTEGSQ